MVTFMCLPLLGLELLGAGSGSATDDAIVRTDGGDPSLVVAVVPSTTEAPVTEPETTTSTEAPVTTSAAPSTTSAPSTTARPTTTAPPPTTAAPPPPPPPPPPPTPPPAPAVGTGSDWDRLAQCESGGNWAMNSGNGYSGGLQFHPGTWRYNGGTEFAPEAWMASREQQIVVAERIRAGQGWSAWPACSRKLGLR